MAKRKNRSVMEMAEYLLDIRALTYFLVDHPYCNVSVSSILQIKLHTSK